MSDGLTLDYLNSCDEITFISRLAGIFEHSPWVAEQVVGLRPFVSVDDLHVAMVNAVANSSSEAKLTLIRNHPELAGKEAETGQLTAESTREQRGAGLDQCSAEELTQLREFNRAYLERFGFPFVIAVSGLDRRQILQQMQQRLQNTQTQELETSVTQIARIARIRLDQLIPH
ncbi:MAG: 2-oxo-4-hydroxy-4-carboxy-5-ureidoimidazoline decarboxylase [Gammaproteobacteria bacterium]|nr:2-oxo-4-hydroxy-4-carboxy-5-ureidoimidazoline decarboxylase [Gammaproteobacteria bacterium]